MWERERERREKAREREKERERMGTSVCVWGGGRGGCECVCECDDRLSILFHCILILWGPAHRLVLRANLHLGVDNIQHPHHNPLFLIVIPHLHNLGAGGQESAGHRLSAVYGKRERKWFVQRAAV